MIMKHYNEISRKWINCVLKLCKTILLKILFFSLILILSTVTSCKKDGNNQVGDEQNKIKNVSIKGSGIATITTVNGNQYTEDLAITSKNQRLSSLPDSSIVTTLTFRLPTETNDPKSGGVSTPNKVDPAHPTATITYMNGYTTVSLSDYSYFINGITTTATVYGISGNSSGGSFFISWVSTVGGQVTGTSTAEYFYHF